MDNNKKIICEWIIICWSVAQCSYQQLEDASGFIGASENCGGCSTSRRHIGDIKSQQAPQTALMLKQFHLMYEQIIVIYLSQLRQERRPRRNQTLRLTFCRHAV